MQCLRCVAHASIASRARQLARSYGLAAYGHQYIAQRRGCCLRIRSDGGVFKNFGEYGEGETPPKDMAVASTSGGLDGQGF